MLKLTGAAIAAISAFAAAQSPLTTTFANNNSGASGGGVYFDLVVDAATDIQITAFDINTTAAVGSSVQLDIYVACPPWTSATPGAANWQLLGTGAGVAAGVGTPTAIALAAPITMPNGVYAIGLHHVTMAAAYTTGTGGFPLVYTTGTSGIDGLTLNAGGASNVLFTGTPFNPRVWNGNIHFLANTGAAPSQPLPLSCARVRTYGRGCCFGAKSWYEAFPNLTAVDLGGAVGAETVVHANNLGPAGWAVSSRPSAWFTPLAAAPNVLTAAGGVMGDDSMSGPLLLATPYPLKGGSATPVVHACSNGFIIMGSTALTSGDFSPTVAELLNTAGQERACALWADLHPGRNTSLNPAAGLYFDVDPASPNLSYVTWLDVGEFANGTAGASSMNFQVCIDSSNGDLEYRYQVIAPATGSSPTIVGHSQGQVGGVNSTDPGNRDLTAAMPFSTDGPDRRPLTLRSTRPVIGALATINVTNIEPAVVMNILFGGFGKLDPGIPLPAIGLAAPGCELCLRPVPSPIILAIDFLPNQPTWSLSVPGLFTSPLWKGVPFNLQAASIVPGKNPAGIKSSNCVELIPGFL